MTAIDKGSDLTPEEFEMIRRIIYDSIGVNLKENKKSLVVSRLSRRLKELGFTTYTRYLQYLKNSPEEVNIMFNCITTNVTSFFREKHHFDYLENHYLPRLEEMAKKK